MRWHSCGVNKPLSPGLSTPPGGKVLNPATTLNGIYHASSGRMASIVASVSAAKLTAIVVVWLPEALK